MRSGRAGRRRKGACLGALAAVLMTIAASCSTGSGPLPSGSGVIGPTAPGGAVSPSPTATTASGEASPGPPASGWEIVTDEPAWAGLELGRVVSGGPGLVALGFADDAVLLTSVDGRRWEAVPIEPRFTCGGLWRGALASGAGGLVAAGSTYDAADFACHFVSWRSDDGEVWTRGAPLEGDDAVGVATLIDAGPGFLAVGCEARAVHCGGLVVLASNDGHTFDRVPDIPRDEEGAGLGGTLGDPGYLVWGTSCTELCNSERVLTWISPDGSAWSTAEGPPKAADSLRFTSATAWATGYLAVGAVGAFDRGAGTVAWQAAAWTSPDGRSWDQKADRTAFGDGTLSAVLDVGDHLIAAGSLPDGDATRAALWTSDDGAAWQRVPDTAAFDGGAIAALAVGPAGLVAVGQVASGAGIEPAAWVGPLP